MAASTSTAAHSNNNSCYDVFISHRGPDVKKTFASHLYHRLISYGLRVFLDYKELQEGEEFPCQIKDAIKTASVQIAIFSPTYADSQWCLDELVLMLETRAHIIPVFHHVKPTELRRTQGEGVYATSLRNLEKKRKYDSEPRYDSKTIENWRNALSRVADISGFDLDEGFNGDEGELQDRLVEVVLKKGKKTLNVARYPTGLDEKVEEFETRLSLHQHSEIVQFVGITGLGGAGKTTLAKELFNRKSSRYSKSCFLIDVRENVKISVASLQRKLLKDLSGSEERIDSKDEGLEILRKHFSVLSDPVLLVLDDVDHHDQVHALLPVTDKGTFPLPPSSLILITARDKNVLTRSGVQEPSIYKLTGLNTERSRELFCSHAFSQPHPTPGFEDLVNQFLKACNGLPLSLKVFGGLLYGNTNKSYWKDELEELRKALPDEIQNSLQISYDALPREEQQIFLDIACFFIGESRDTAIRVWDASGWNGSRGFENLLSKCLVELDIIFENPFDMYEWNENPFHMYERPMKYCIRMHDHLRDMGRYLANNTPGFPCRLWRGTKHQEDLLQQSSEATKVRGIRMLRWEHYYDERADSDSDSDVDNELASFSRYKMKNLQLLDIDMEEDHLKCLLDGMDSPNLLWFRWRNCRRSSLPPYIPMKKLWVLEVEGGYNLEMETLWQEDLQTPFRLRELRITVDVLHKIPKSIGQLKHLELMVVYTMAVYIRADDTVEIPKEFCDLRSLKHLVLKIPQLRSLPDSFGNLSRLEHINLSYCNALERLPDSFGHLSKLEHIDLSFCSALERLPDSFGDLSSLQSINLERCRALERLPDSFGDLSKLEHIDLSFCGALQNLPDSFGNLSKLEHINLAVCCALERLPDSFGDLSSLQRIDLSSCHALQNLPDSFGNLSKLEHINLEKCRALERLPDSFGDLSSLQYIKGFGLKRLPDSFGNLSKLEHIDLEKCSALERLPDSFGDLWSLQRIDLSCCDALQNLPDSFGNLSKLEHINLAGCCALERLPDSFGDLSSLQRIGLSGCDALQNLPDSFGNLSKLEHINLEGCRALERLPDSFGDLSSLQRIDLYSCHALHNVFCGLERLPNSFVFLSSLERFDLSSCHDLPRCNALQNLPDSFGNLSKLEHINLRGCCALERLPDSFGNLSSLQHIDLSGCNALERLPDSFGNLSSLQHIDLSYCRALGRLPDSFGNLIKLKYISLWECHKLTIPGGTFRKITLEYMRFPEWRIEVLPPQIAHQWSLEKLLLCLINMGEWPSATGESSHLEKLVLDTPFLEALPPSFGRDLRNLKYLELRSCHSLKCLPDSFLLMDQLIKLIVEDCPLQELHFETVEGASETMTDSGGQGTLSNLERGQLRLQHLELHKTQISEISFPTGVCNNLHSLDIRDCQDLVEVGTLPNALIKLQLIDCPKLRKIERLSGFAKLKTLGVSRCKEVEELPSIKDTSVALAESTGPRELNNSDYSFDNCLLHLQHLELHNTAISEVLYPTGVCPNLQYLDIKDCQDLVDVGTLPNALIKLKVYNCSKLRTIGASFPTGGCPNLQDLDIRDCNDLEEVTFSKALINLKLYNCSKLRQIAASFSTGVCPNLQDLDIRFCQDLVEVTLPNVPKVLTFYKCSNLRKIDASFSTGVCDIRECEDLAEVMTLQSAHERRIISNSSKLRKIGGSFPSGVYPKVQYLVVEHCENLEELEIFPSALEHLRIEECEELVEVGTLPNAVIKLQLIDCPKLKKIERLCGFAKLQTLNVTRRKDVEELPSIEGKSERLAESRGERALSNLDSSLDKCLLCLQHLELHNTAISEVSFPMGVCPNLQHLDIRDCKDLIEVRTLPNALIKLQLYDCPKLKLMSIADLAQMMQLREIRVQCCYGLEELLGVGYLKSLQVMQVSGCMKLKSITGLEQLTQLRELDVSNCCELKELLGVGHLKSLEVLQASGCAKLKSILGVDQLTQLRKLDVPFNTS